MSQREIQHPQLGTWHSLPLGSQDQGHMHGSISMEVSRHEPVSLPQRGRMPHLTTVWPWGIPLLWQWEKRQCFFKASAWLVSIMSTHVLWPQQRQGQVQSQWSGDVYSFHREGWVRNCKSNRILPLYNLRVQGDFNNGFSKGRSKKGKGQIDLLLQIKSVLSFFFFLFARVHVHLPERCRIPLL